MWKDVRFILFLFLLCLVLAIYDKFSGAFFMQNGEQPQVLGKTINLFDK